MWLIAKKNLLNLKILWSTLDFISITLIPFLFIPIVKEYLGEASLITVLSLMPVLSSTFMIEFGSSNARQKFGFTGKNRTDFLYYHAITLLSLFVWVFFFFNYLTLNNTELVLILSILITEIVDFDLSAQLRRRNKVELNLKISSVFNFISILALWSLYLWLDDLTFALSIFLVVRLVKLLVKIYIRIGLDTERPNNIKLGKFYKFRIGHGLLALNGFLFFNIEKIYFTNFTDNLAANLIIITSFASLIHSFPAAAFSFLMHDYINGEESDLRQRKFCFLQIIIGSVIFTGASFYLVYAMNMDHNTILSNYLPMCIIYFLYSFLIPKYFKISATENAFRYSLLSTLIFVIYAVILFTTHPTVINFIIFKFLTVVVFSILTFGFNYDKDS